MSSLISLENCREQGRSGVLIEIIFDGVVIKKGWELDVKAFDGVEQKANL